MIQLRKISVAGTSSYPDDDEHRARLAQFRTWLSGRHPEASLIIRSRFRPEEYGRCKVTVTPAVEPIYDHQKTEVHIERSAIEQAWRDQVGWMH